MKLWNIFRKRQKPTYIELVDGDRIYKIEPPKNEEEFFELKLDKGLSNDFRFNLNLNDWNRFGFLKKYTITNDLCQKHLLFELSCNLEGEHYAVGNWIIKFICQGRSEKMTVIDVSLNVRDDFMCKTDFYNLIDAEKWVANELEKIIKQNNERI